MNEERGTLLIKLRSRKGLQYATPTLPRMCRVPINSVVQMTVLQAYPYLRESIEAGACSFFYPTVGEQTYNKDDGLRKFETK